MTRGPIAGLCASLATAAVAIGQPLEPQLSAFLTQIGLSQQERASLEARRPVAKVLS